MAENESLDIDSRYGKAWRHLVHAAESGQSHELVAAGFKKTFHRALKRAIKQLQKCSVTISDFVNARFSRSRCDALLKQCMGNDFARLLVDVMRANPNAHTEQLVQNWLYGVRDKILAQIGSAVLGSGHYPSTSEVQSLSDSVEVYIERDIDNVVEGLMQDPTHVPNALPNRGKTKVNPTEQILQMSLLESAP
jgi:hypothetical protein